MSHWDISSFSTDLSTFIDLINRYELPIESSSLYDLDGRMPSLQQHHIEVKDISFAIDKKIAHTNPSNISKISILFSHCCEIDPQKDTQQYDPIKSNYHFYIQINGYDDNSSEYRNCWRLDQHINPNQQAKYTHPYYHFQSGGNELLGLATGDIIFLGAPRLPHPPMDLFLGIHFIISNFYSLKDYPWVAQLYGDYSYQQIIKRAQKRMWEPYFNSFTLPNDHLDFTFEKVFPLFIN